MIFNPLDFPIIFSQPWRTSQTGELAHVPFGMFIVDLIRPNRIVELGTNNGDFYCALCQAVQELNLDTRCYAIGTWQEHAGSTLAGQGVLEDLKKHHDPLYQDFSELIQSSLDEALERFESGTIDLLHITGDHTYEAAKRLFERWLPKVSKHGVVLLHNIRRREKDVGIWKLWTELRTQYAAFEFTHSQGLGVLAPSDHPPENLDVLLKLSENEAQRTQHFFRIIGENLEAEFEKARLRQQWERETEQKAEANAQLRLLEQRWAVLQHSAGWRILQKFQELQKRVFRPGSRQNTLLQTLLALRLLGKDVLYILPRYLLRHLPKRSKKPAEVSIVIPVFNLLHLTQGCLESIYQNTRSYEFEVIVIDNASNDATARWLIAQRMRRQNLKVLWQTENIGFGPAINKGLEHSQGRFIVLLNNDTLVAPGWLDHLIAVMEQDPRIGIISPVTNYVGEGAQIDQSAKDLPANMEAIAGYARTIEERSAVFYEPNRLVFFCVLLRREVVARVGYLDTSYTIGNFEDDDYCFRTRLAGYRLAVTPNAFVYHIGSATFKGNSIPHAQLMDENRQKFYKKVGRLATSAFHFPPSLPRDREVSVVLRTMNTAATLQDALMSLANQTYKDFEVIVVNDGGREFTTELLPFQDHFPITYIRHAQNQGRSAAANTGIEHSAGKWITFLDDDDIVYPWHLESLVQAAKTQGKQFVYSDFNRAIFSKTESPEPDLINTPPSWDFDIEELQVINHIPIHCWLFVRACVNEVGMMNPGLEMLEDYDFLLRLSTKFSFQHLPKITCEYRFYQSNQNSVFVNISKTLHALQTIYRNYPVQDSHLSIKRAQMIYKMQKQVEKVNEIVINRASDEPASHTNREIIRTILEL